MSELPEPLVPAEVDLRDFAFMPLDVVRLRDSGIAARANGEEFRAAVLLWCASWHQQPAASLPDDEAELAHLAGLGRAMKAWKKVRDGAMRGWIKCSDGRLYHPVVAEKALESWEKKASQRARTAAATEARRQRGANRNDDRGADRDDARNDQRNVDRNDQRGGQHKAHQGTGTVKGERERIDTPADVEVSDPQARKLVETFKAERRRKWPTESGFPAPDVTLKAQAAELLAKPGASFDLIAEVLKREVERDERSAPLSFKAYGRSIESAILGNRNPAANGHAAPRPRVDPTAFTDGDWRACMTMLAQHDHWPDSWEARPAKGRWAKGCLVPKHIQREFEYGQEDAA